jgi:hypothetical protein
MEDALIQDMFHGVPFNFHGIEALDRVEEGTFSLVISCGAGS